MKLPSSDTNRDRVFTRSRSLPYGSRLWLIRELETRTERVYHKVNGNPGVETSGRRQHALKAIPDLSGLALFFRHTYNILSIYKKNSPVVMIYHRAEITTENIHLEGNQQFLLDWLLEHLQFIMASDGERQREHVVKFFDVWSEVYGMFWW